MIVAFINGKKAYPSTGTGVKITLENPFIKEGEERTMEVAFPFSIPENYSIFGSLNRIDTSFETGIFEDCAIVVDNIEVVRGKGRVTSVTKDELKLQIRGGSSGMRFKESFKNIFIDSIFYGNVESRHEFLGRGLSISSGLSDLSSDYTLQGFVGSPGKYAFLPVYDESNDLYINTPCAYVRGNQVATSLMPWRKAIMPNLMWVLKKVMQRIGYTIKENYYDRDPWAKLYVCSARETVNMAKALPHWSVYTFLDEFRKLFNATFIFNDGEKSVRILPFSESALMDTVEYEPTDEFDASFDEDGIEYLGTSNLEFELSGSERTPDCLTEDILGAFDVEEFSSKAAAYASFSSKTERGKLTTIFKFPEGYAYGKPLFFDEGEINTILFNDCGYFSPLIRKDQGSSISLKMVPVAMSWHDEAVCYLLNQALVDIIVTLNNTKWFRISEEEVLEEFPFSGLIANIECEETYDYKGEREEIDMGYTTVAEVIEEGGSVPSDSESQEIMQLIFAASQTIMRKCGERLNAERYDYTGLVSVNRIALPVGYTDYRMLELYSSLTSGEIHLTSWPKNSLSIMPVSGASAPGNFHNSGVKIRRTIDGNNQVKIPFICDGKPDVTKKFLFRNKLYLCAKVEMNVTGEGIDRLKTGYFYELL
jgi:hypothetical protein